MKKCVVAAAVTALFFTFSHHAFPGVITLGSAESGDLLVDTIGFRTVAVSNGGHTWTAATHSSKDGAGKYQLMFADGAAATLVVDTEVDELDGSCSDGDCSLRDAIALANASSADDTITFGPSVGFIELNGTEIVIQNNGTLSIIGPGANLLRVGYESGSTSRIFYVDNATAEISGIELTEGSNIQGGSAILAVGGAVTLRSMYFTFNSPGCVFFAGGTHQVIDSSFAFNSGAVSGVIRNTGTLTVTNSTLHANSGTAIHVDGPTTLHGVTVTNTSGDGVHVQVGSSLTFGSSIITANQREIARNSGSTVTSQGFNLVGDNSGDAANTIVPITYQSTDILDTNPLLSSFALFGGPTRTRVPLSGSPAIDKGTAFGATTDQRGQPRTIDHAGITNAADGTDIGAVEKATTEPEIDIKGNNQSIASGDITPSLEDHTDFGPTPTLGGTVVRTFTIENTGTAALNLTGSPVVEMLGSNPSEFTVTQPVTTVIATSSFTTFDVTFDPAADGLRTAQTRISSDDPDESAYVFSIRGTGTISFPEIDIQGSGVSIANGDTSPSPTDHTDFGSTDVSVGMVARTFTIFNFGDADLNLTGTPAVVISGTNADDFSVTVAPATPVGAGSSTEVQISFDPSAVGLRTAAVSVANDDADENPYSFFIQGTGAAPPETSINSSPLALDDRTTATFTFSSNDGAATFECQLDSGGFSECTSPQTYNSLGDGPHTFDVRAVAGGITDPTPASFAWTIDTSGPDTLITSGPPNPSPVTFADFAFSSPDTGVFFDCSLNGATFAPCSSPTTIVVADFMTHTFRVRARDIANNVDFVPAFYAWSVQSSPAGAVSVNSPFTSESVGTINVSVYRTDGTTGEVTVQYQTDNVSATGGPTCSSGVDFINTSGTLTFVDGDDIGDIPVQICDDADPEAVEAFNVTLSNPTGGLAISQRNPGTVRIDDNEQSEIDIQGNGISIADGDSTPSLIDHTDFGSRSVSSGSLTRSFNILNLGIADLHLTGLPVVVITGAHAADFTVTVVPATPVSAGSSTEMQITFEPSAMGPRMATVAISNDDSDENPYDFAIQGTGCPSIFGDGFEGGDACH